VTNEADPGLRRPMELGQIIEGAIRTYRLHFGELLAIAAVTLPVNAIGAIIAGLIEDKVIATAVTIGFAVPAIVIGLAAQAAIARAYADVADGETPDFESTYKRVLPAFGRLFVTALRIFIVVVALAITVVGIPFAIYFMIRWVFFAQAIVIEGESSSGATDLSARIVQGHWWRTFGILIMVGLLASVPAAVVSLVFSAAAPVAASLATGVVGVVVLPFSAGAETLLFFDLQARDRQRMGMVDQGLSSQ
jgi:hypothetical protein